MILSYNWQILQQPIQTQHQLQQRTKNNMPQPEDSFNSQSLQSANLSLSPTILSCPSFGFLFCYYMQAPTTNQPQLQLSPQLSLFQQHSRLKTVRSLRNKHCIYLWLQIQSSQAYDAMLVLNVKIKYHSQPKLAKMKSIQQLVRMAGNRQINLYTAHTYTTLKREIILQSPVSIQWKHQQEAYLYLKITRPEETNTEVEILQVQVMNWLARKEETRRIPVRNLVNKPFKLKPKESYALVFSMEGIIIGQEIPYYIIYRLGPQETRYKMVKYINFFDQL